VTGAVLVLCAPDDAGAAELVARLAPDSLAVTPADLSSPGWSYTPLPARRRGVAGGRRFSVGDLRAVVTRLVAVDPSCLPHVRSSDRDYVAAEETAFLRAWLTGLPVRVISPPRASSLSGPLWHPARWAQLAAGLGIEVLPSLGRARVPGPPEPDAAGSEVNGATDGRVGVCGKSAVRDRLLGERHVAMARALAAAAGADYLSAGFQGDRLCVVDTWPAPGRPEELDLLATELADHPGEDPRREPAP
jgi:hypothetical protein